jgi:hypothetical protein
MLAGRFDDLDSESCLWMSGSRSSVFSTGVLPRLLSADPLGAEMLVRVVLHVTGGRSDEDDHELIDGEEGTICGGLRGTFGLLAARG